MSYTNNVSRYAATCVLQNLDVFDSQLELEIIDDKSFEAKFVYKIRTRNVGSLPISDCFQVEYFKAISSELSNPVDIKLNNFKPTRFLIVSNIDSYVPFETITALFETLEDVKTVSKLNVGTKCGLYEFCDVKSAVKVVCFFANFNLIGSRLKIEFFQERKTETEGQRDWTFNLMPNESPKLDSGY